MSKRNIVNTSIENVKKVKKASSSSIIPQLLSSSSSSSSSSNLPFNVKKFNQTRARLINNKIISNINNNQSCVIYWMSRDQRVENNWALIYAQGIALEREIPLKVVFNLVPKFLDATLRQYRYLINLFNCYNYLIM